jgi:hypothetical protein
MIWEAVIVVYLLMGLGFSWMSNKGHRVLYGTPMHWSAWIAGTIGWLPAFIIAGWRKK